MTSTWSWNPVFTEWGTLKQWWTDVGNWFPIEFLVKQNIHTILYKIHYILELDENIQSASLAPHFNILKASKLIQTITALIHSKGKDISHFFEQLCLITLFLHKIQRCQVRHCPPHPVTSLLPSYPSLSTSRASLFSWALVALFPFFGISRPHFLLCFLSLVSSSLLTWTISFKHMQALTFFTSNYHFQRSFPSLPNPQNDSVFDISACSNLIWSY